jgi:hypothetical protein
MDALSPGACSTPSQLRSSRPQITPRCGLRSTSPSRADMRHARVLAATRPRNHHSEKPGRAPCSHARSVGYPRAPQTFAGTRSTRGSPLRDRVAGGGVELNGAACWLQCAVVSALESIDLPYSAGRMIQSATYSRICGPGSRQESTNNRRTRRGVRSKRRASAAHTPAIIRPRRGRISAVEGVIGRP